MAGIDPSRLVMPVMRMLGMVIKTMMIVIMMVVMVVTVIMTARQ